MLTPTRAPSRRDAGVLNMLVAFFSLGLPKRDGLSSTQSGTDVLSRDEMANVLDQPAVPAELREQQAMSSSCPSNVKGILYNHIPKTGGTLINHMLDAVFLDSDDPEYLYEEDIRGNKQKEEKT